MPLVIKTQGKAMSPTESPPFIAYYPPHASLEHRGNCADKISAPLTSIRHCRADTIAVMSAVLKLAKTTSAGLGVIAFDFVARPACLFRPACRSGREHEVPRTSRTPAPWSRRGSSGRSKAVNTTSIRPSPPSCRIARRAVAHAWERGRVGR